MIQKKLLIEYTDISTKLYRYPDKSNDPQCSPLTDAAKFTGYPNKGFDVKYNSD